MAMSMGTEGEMAIQERKERKLEGIDRVTSEMLKMLTKVRLLNRAWQTKKVPVK